MAGQKTLTHKRTQNAKAIKIDSVFHELTGELFVRKLTNHLADFPSFVGIIWIVLPCRAHKTEDRVS